MGVRGAGGRKRSTITKNALKFNDNGIYNQGIGARIVTSGLKKGVTFPG